MIYNGAVTIEVRFLWPVKLYYSDTWPVPVQYHAISSLLIIAARIVATVLPTLSLWLVNFNTKWWLCVVTERLVLNVWPKRRKFSVMHSTICASVYIDHVNNFSFSWTVHVLLYTILDQMSVSTVMDASILTSISVRRIFPTSTKQSKIYFISICTKLFATHFLKDIQNERFSVL